MQVSEIMTPHAQLIDPNATIREAARLMRSENVGALPVGENNQLIGIVTDRDIVMRAVAEDRSAGITAVRDVMSEGVYYCFEEDDVGEAARVMAEHQVRRLPVVNSGNQLTGILALADLVQAGSDAETTALEGVSEPTEDPRR